MQKGYGRVEGKCGYLLGPVPVEGKCVNSVLFILSITNPIQLKSNYKQVIACVLSFNRKNETQTLLFPARNLLYTHVTFLSNLNII